MMLKLVTDIVTETYRISFDYSVLNQVLKVMKDMDLECYEQDFNLICTMNVKVRKSQVELMKKRLELIESVKLTFFMKK